jgi:hypothetical protein
LIFYSWIYILLRAIKKSRHTISLYYVGVCYVIS